MNNNIFLAYNEWNLYDDIIVHPHRSFFVIKGRAHIKR